MVDRLESHRSKIFKWRATSSCRIVRQETTQGEPGYPIDKLQSSSLCQGRRLLILATTSNRSILRDMDVESAFDTDIPVSPIDKIEGVDFVLKEVKLFPSSKEHARAMQMLQDAKFGQEGRAELLVGIKKLLGMAEMARQDPDPAYKLVSSLVREVS